MVDAAKSLADLQAKGLIKQVGLTNMNVEAVSSIVDAGVPVANNQVGALAALQDSWHMVKYSRLCVGKQGLLRMLQGCWDACQPDTNPGSNSQALMGQNRSPASCLDWATPGSAAYCCFDRCAFLLNLCMYACSVSARLPVAPHGRSLSNHCSLG
jgi:hypothetical protein